MTDSQRMSEESSGTRGTWLPRSALESIATHAEETYPQECFGFLVGRFGDESIHAVCPGSNTNASRPHDRYEMNPEEFLQTQVEAEEWGGEVVGFYHSHPDDKAIPSTYDRDRAWEEYLYLIVPVADGRAGKARLWKLESPDEGFAEIVILSANAEEKP